jgi:hypothetical protein
VSPPWSAVQGQVDSDESGPWLGAAALYSGGGPPRRRAELASHLLERPQDTIMRSLGRALHLVIAESLSALRAPAGEVGTLSGTTDDEAGDPRSSLMISLS